MLYMARRYAVDVRMPRDELLGWHRADPPDRWELERAGRVEALTGLRNPLYRNAAAVFGSRREAGNEILGGNGDRGRAQ